MEKLRSKHRQSCITHTHTQVQRKSSVYSLYRRARARFYQHELKVSPKRAPSASRSPKNSVLVFNSICVSFATGTTSAPITGSSFGCSSSQATVRALARTHRREPSRCVQYRAALARPFCTHTRALRRANSCVDATTTPQRSRHADRRARRRATGTRAQYHCAQTRSSNAEDCAAPHSSSVRLAHRSAHVR